MPLLTAHNAVIKTAAVEIKTLSVSGKQVTLAVFRQIIEEPIFDFDTGQLRGVGWGHVRYLVPDQEDVINLVWQHGDQLRRCLLRRTLHPWWSQERAAKFLEHPFEHRSYKTNDYIPRHFYTAWEEYFVDAGVPRSLKLPHPYPHGDLEEERNARAVNVYTNQVRASFIPKIKHALSIYAAYERIVPALFDLPQLFIAV